MSYLVISRKYRPSVFDTVIGQQHVTQTLKNAITRNRIGHAYLLTGPRGVGKTSIARIFAKAVNCQTGLTISPCGECVACTEISKGISLSVLEIDGASHNSVDNVRELIETFRSLPPPGYRYKVYIIDEVHMLSIAAFNALLKSLEEPPANTVFILATTEAHKIPDTVLSRCQRHDLRALAPQQIYEKLIQILGEEGIKFDETAIRLIAKAADGSLRDGQSLLERIMSYSEEKISEDATVDVLGLVEKNILFGLSSAIFSRNPEKALTIVNDVFSGGIDSTTLLKQVTTHFREALIVKFAGNKEISELSLSEPETVEFKRQVSAIDGHDLQDLVSIAITGADQALRSFHVKYAFESLLIRMATREPIHNISALLQKIESGSIVKSSLTSSSKIESGKIEPGKSYADSRDSVAYSYSPVKKTNNTSIRTNEENTVPVGDLEKLNIEVSNNSNSNQALDWNIFVARIVASGEDKILSQQLKAVVVDEFQPGLLKLRCTEFVMKYLQIEANRKKLDDQLKKLVSNVQWKIESKVVAEKELVASGTSILVEEEKQEETSRSDRELKAKQHSALKNLQSVFPGSTIEGVRAK